MHNLLSYNLLNEWRHFESKFRETESETSLVNDYFECLIECEDNQAACKRTCKGILSEVY